MGKKEGLVFARLQLPGNRLWVGNMSTVAESFLKKGELIYMLDLEV